MDGRELVYHPWEKGMCNKAINLSANEQLDFMAFIILFFCSFTDKIFKNL